MGMQAWRGVSQKEYTFATYPVILPPDLASIARFYMGKPIIYAFIGYKSTLQLTPQPIPLYFGAAADGFRRLSHENLDSAHIDLLNQCDEIHILQAPADETARSAIMTDLLAAYKSAKPAAMGILPARQPGLLEPQDVWARAVG